LEPLDFENPNRKKNPPILDFHPNGLDFIGILTHRFLEYENSIKLLTFFLSVSSKSPGMQTAPYYGIGFGKVSTLVMKVRGSPRS
jgi:hypothetical protein